MSSPVGQLLNSPGRVIRGVVDLLVGPDERELTSVWLLS